MLRSLVGSEMCIRDSFRTLTVRANESAEAVSRAYAALERVQGNIAGVKACLLYTSDAADDLLCVDLGGRRIIKKKTTQYYSIRRYELYITRPR